MSTLVLHDHPSSTNALKARILLAELGLDYDSRLVPPQWPRPDWHVAVTPFGTTPALLDGEVVIGESNTILRYLAGREGRDDLYGATPVERARVDWVLDAWSSQARPRFWALEKACLYDTGDPDEGGGDPEAADPAVLEAALAGIEEVMPAWERLLSGGDAVLDRFTIADCAVAPVLWRSHRLPLDLGRWPRTARLRETLCARPSFLAAAPPPRHGAV